MTTRFDPNKAQNLVEVSIHNFLAGSPTCYCLLDRKTVAPILLIVDLPLLNI